MDSVQSLRGVAISTNCMLLINHVDICIWLSQNTALCAEPHCICKVTAQTPLST